MEEVTTIKANMLKCGARTYFFDVKVAKNNSKYLIITESRFVKKGEERKRNTFILFKEDLSAFVKKLEEVNLE